MQTKNLQVADEVAALGDGLKALIVDIKAKKGATAIASDVLTDLVSAVSGYQNIGADLKTVDDQVYLVKCIAEAFES